mmetsp:Transcript_6298/g.19449  ORF Transcript_6298/g.19449 Transcript_6298/m.19449 type:complete len:481 (+) Transcript_6298:522-1964(+)
MVLLAGPRRLARRQLAVVRAPEPDVVEDDVRRGDLGHDVGADVRRPGPADAREDVREHRRIFRRARAAPAQQDRRRRLGRLEDDAREADAALVVDDDARLARVRRDQRREAQSEQDRAGPRNLQRRVEVEDARRQHDVQAGVERRLNVVRVVLAGARHEHVFERYLRRGRVARARDVAEDLRDHEDVRAVVVHGNEGLLRDDGRRADDRDARLVDDGLVLVFRVVRDDVLRRRAVAAHEDVGPRASRRAVPQLDVPREPLLLRPEHQRPFDDGVREEAARRVVHPGGGVEELQVAVDDDAPQRRGLRDRPAEALLSDVAEVLGAPPERVERPRLLRVHGVDVNTALSADNDVLGPAAEARDLHVVAHLRVDGVRARGEEERAALRREMALLAVGEPRGQPRDLFLNCRVVAGPEDAHAGAPVRRVRLRWKLYGFEDHFFGCALGGARLLLRDDDGRRDAPQIQAHNRTEHGSKDAPQRRA